LLARLAEAVGNGFTIAAVPPEESRFVDIVPELTNVVAPERRYKYLVRVPHKWRRQLSFKGRRLAVGQFMAQMRANDCSPEQAAADFDLPVEAVQEAIDYAARNAALIKAEAAEERRFVETFDASSPR
jgi:uncharacterized protein (DUF433 family)